MKNNFGASNFQIILFLGNIISYASTYDFTANIRKLFFIPELFSNNYIINMNHSDLSHFFDSIKTVTEYMTSIFKTSTRIKQLFEFMQDITDQKQKKNSIKSIAEWALQGLECERITVFKVEFAKGEMHSIASIGGEENFQMSIKLNSGLIGEAVKKKCFVNVRDAQSDKRFDPEVDTRPKITSKSVMLVPIYNRMHEVDGVIEAINKKPDPMSEMTRFFSQDDEGLIEMLSTIMGVALNDSIMLNDHILQYNNLQNILKAGVYLNKFDNKNALCRAAEVQLKQLFDCSKAYVFLINHCKNKLYRYGDEGQKTYAPINCGILGLA